MVKKNKQLISVKQANLIRYLAAERKLLHGVRKSIRLASRGITVKLPRVAMFPVVVRILERYYKKKRKKRLESLVLVPVVLSDERVKELNVGHTRLRRQQKQDKKEARLVLLNDKGKRAIESKRSELESRWGKELSSAGWKQTQKGWRNGNKTSLPVEEALASVRLNERSSKEFENTRIASYLHEKGWTVSGNNHDVWSRPNWQTTEGTCYRTLKQAHKIQLGLDTKS